MVDDTNKSFAALVELQKQQIIKDAQKRKEDERKADIAHKLALQDLEDLKQTIQDKAVEDTKNLEIEAKLLKEDLKSIKITQEYFDAMTADLERRQIQIQKTEEEAEKKRKADIASAVKVQEKTVADRKENEKKQAAMSKEKKKIETQKQTLDKMKKKAVDKGLKEE